MSQTVKYFIMGFTVGPVLISAMGLWSWIFYKLGVDIADAPLSLIAGLFSFIALAVCVAAFFLKD